MAHLRHEIHGNSGLRQWRDHLIEEQHVGERLALGRRMYARGKDVVAAAGRVAGHNACGLACRVGGGGGGGDVGEGESREADEGDGLRKEGSPFT